MPDIRRQDAVVELHLAYMWDCNSCGCENFVRAMVPSLSDEEIEELRDEHGVQPWETGKFTTAPSSVKCSHCGAEFETDHSVDGE